VSETIAVISLFTETDEKTTTPIGRSVYYYVGNHCRTFPKCWGAGACVMYAGRWTPLRKRSRIVRRVSCASYPALVRRSTGRRPWPSRRDRGRDQTILCAAGTPRPADGRPADVRMMARGLKAPSTVDTGHRPEESTYRGKGGGGNAIYRNNRPWQPPPSTFVRTTRELTNYLRRTVRDFFP